MELQPLLVGPSLLGMAELFRRFLILRHVHPILRLIQVQICGPKQHQHDNDRNHSDPLHMTPSGWSTRLSFPRNRSSALQCTLSPNSQEHESHTLPGHNLYNLTGLRKERVVPVAMKSGWLEEFARF